MKRPSMQFYFGDWRNNANLRRCSWEARGVWIEVMGLLHDSDDYGQLRWTLQEIAQAIGAPMKALRELVSKNVLKGCDKGECDAYIYTPRHAGKDGDPVALVAVQVGPIWYSTRMVRDEWVRQKRGAGTRFGDTPNDAPNSPPIPPFGEAPKPQPPQREGDGPSSSSSLKEKERCETAPTARPRGTRLPTGWAPSDDLLHWTRTEKPGIDPLQTLEKFRDHWAAQPGQKGVKTDWDATWRNWVRNEIPRAGGLPANGQRFVPV